MKKRRNIDKVIPKFLKGILEIRLVRYHFDPLEQGFKIRLYLKYPNIKLAEWTYDNLEGKII